MLKRLPESSESFERVIKKLEKYTSDDIDVEGGKLFTYLYDSGLKELSRVNDIYVEFLNRNAMDYNAFPSTLRLENDVVAMIGSLLNGDDEVTGNFTTGGTESILIAMKAARDWFLERIKGKETVEEKNRTPAPEVIIPVTAHPAFRKAAEYLGMKAVHIPVQQDTYLAEAEIVKKHINENTAVIVASAPNFPFGVIDPIDDLGKLALENGLWLHVDACVGGLILPFLSRIGKKIKNWDFSVPGVSSISVDLHKYGYTPKGSSVILYRNKDLRRYQLYVNANWPGYPMSNIGVQSTKSSAPLAASWAVLNYLGEEGYLKLARATLSAKEKISRGIVELGYRIVGYPDATIFAFTNDDLDMFEVGAELKNHGWFLQTQPGSVELGMPPSLHLNSSPVHDGVAPEFLKSLDEVTQKLKGKGPRKEDEIMADIGLTKGHLNAERVADLLTAENSPLKSNRNLLYELIRHLPADVIENAFKNMVNSDFRASTE